MTTERRVGTDRRCRMAIKADILKRLAEARMVDPEVGHMDADELLLRFIDDDDIRDAFHAVPKWYA